MLKGAITQYIDVAQLVLYAFWFFLAALVYYLRREDKREGYPLESSRTVRSGGRVIVQGWPAMPPPKTFKLPNGETLQLPDGKRDLRPIAAKPANRWSGAPLEPTGNPMLDGVGPASYAERADHPELTIDGHPRMVPMRVATEFFVEPNDPDPRGMPVFGADGVQGGTIVDIWVDRSEPQIRYFELETAGGRKVLVPMALAKIDRLRRKVAVISIHGAQFAHVPGIANPDLVTLLEEDKICAYYGGGTLYADPERQEPFM
jgi:photosynthetic reaction center H subunit